MRTALQNLRIQLDQVQARRGSDRRFFGWFFGCLALFSVLLTGLSWIDYLHPVPVQDVFVARHASPSENQALTLVELQRATFIQVASAMEEESPLWRAIGAIGEKLGLDGGLTELKSGDALTWWKLPLTRRSTSRLHAPIGMSVVAMMLMSLALMNGSGERLKQPSHLERCIERNEILIPEGCREETLHDPNGRTVAILKSTAGWCSLGVFVPLLLWIMLTFASLLSAIIMLGVLVAYPDMPFDYEWIARFIFAVILPPAALAPLCGLLLIPFQKNRVAWDNRRVWVGFERIARDNIRRVALTVLQGKIVLQIRTATCDQALRVESQPLWTAGILQRLGYTVEYSEKSISEPVRLFRRSQQPPCSAAERNLPFASR